MVQKGDCSCGYYCSTTLNRPLQNQSPFTLYLEFTLPDVLNARCFEFLMYLDYRSL